MTKRIKKNYNTPMVELIEARMEKGFQASGFLSTTKGGEPSSERLGGSGNNYDNSLFT